MDLKRLFHVLVVGGSVAAACEQTRSGGLGAADAARDDAAASDTSSMDAATVDATPAMDAAVATDAADGPGTEPCLCSPTRCCDLHEGAPATVQPGLHCCWGTAC
jgi:hypothetical protein